MHLVGLVAALSMLLASSPPTVAAGRTRLAHHTPAFVHRARDLGPANPARSLDITVWLQPRDGAGLAALAGQIESAGNAMAAGFLTPAQVQARFAPTAATVAAVEDYARTQGLVVTGTAPDRLYVAARGTVAQVEAAFGVDLEQYMFHGQAVVANTADPSVPNALAGYVAAIGGLDGVTAHPLLATANPSRKPPMPGGKGKAGSNQPPTYAQLCAQAAPDNGQTTVSGATYIPCPYSPQGLEDATGFAVGATTGAGQTIAIVDAFGSPTLAQDLTAFDATFALVPAHVHRFGKTTYNPRNPQASSWNLETNLDVQWAHALAPAAPIELYIAPNASDVLFEDVARIVATGSARLVSLSWGAYEAAVPPAELRALDVIFQLAAVEGIGVAVATGDCGDESACDGGVPTVDYPASSPWVTAVGGVSIFPTATSYAWGNTICWVNEVRPVAGVPSCKAGSVFYAGGGGGSSTVFAAPAWQPSPTGKRGLPDVSFLADPYTGVWMTIEGQYIPIGGTSLAAPTFTALMAQADQAAGFAHGLATPWLYKTVESAGGFTDVVNGQTRRLYLSHYTGNLYQVGLGADQGLSAGPGWDDATGLGIPRGAQFIDALR